MLNILFVCEGNTCRSPMAALLFSQTTGEEILIESAGIDVKKEGGKANPKAIEVMKENFGLDLTKHTSTSINSLQLNEYDHIIAMNTNILEELLSSDYDFPNKEQVLHDFEIEDPYDQEIGVYQECAAEIQNKLISFSKKHF